MKTWNAKKHEVKKNWYLVDASTLPLGRLSTRIATVLRGKHKTSFTPNQDTGDFVVVTHSKNVKLTGNKRQSKTYYSHTGYFGSLKEIPFEKMIASKPNEVIYKAVKNMLPKNKLSRQVIKKLKVFPDDNHPYKGKKFQTLKFN